MHLPKKFGLWTGIYVVAANMVGSGILTVSGPILRDTQSVSILFVLWIVGGLISVCGAMIFAEVASSIPKTGGDYAVIADVFGPMWGFVFGLAMITLGFAASLSLLAYTTANYFYPVVKDLLAIAPDEKIFSASLGSFILLGTALFHAQSHSASKYLQATTTLFKLLTLVALASALIYAAPASNNLLPIARKDVSIFAASTAFIQVMYAYTGWNAAAYLAGEMKSPGKSLPKVIVLGTVLVTFIYLLVNLAYVASVPFHELNALSSTQIGRIAEVATTRVFGTQTANLVSLFITLGVIASISSYILTGSRVCFAMAKDGYLPKFLGHVHSKNEVPSIAVMSLAMFSAAILWSGTFEEILNFTGFGLSVLSNLIILAIFPFRKRKLTGPFRSPMFPWMPLLFLLVNNLSLVGSLIDNPKTSLFSLGSVLVGVPLYYICRKFQTVDA